MQRPCIGLWLLITASCVIGTIVGCSGTNEAPPASGVRAGTGNVVITVKWPPRFEAETQRVPRAANAIYLRVWRDGEVIDDCWMLRPAQAPWVTREVIRRVPVCSDATLTAQAYPTSQTTGVIQAAASVRIVIPPNANAYPSGANPGDEIRLTLWSTICTVQVAPNPASVNVGSTVQLTATAKNSNDEIVLVPETGGFVWEVIDGAAYASVDQNGLVTGLAEGTATVRAAETESETGERKSGTAEVTVTHDGGGAVEYEFVTKWGPSDWGSADGQFQGVVGIDVDNNGNVYVVDEYNDRIQKFADDGTFLGWWGGDTDGGTGWHGPGSGREPAGASDVPGFLWKPQDVAVDSNGNVHVVHAGTAFVKFAPNGAILVTWGAGSAQGGDRWYDIALDAAENVYVMRCSWRDAYDRVEKFTSDGYLLHQWGPLGTSDGQFGYAGGAAVGPAGSVYVADGGNNRIQKFTSNGTFLGWWGKDTDGYTGWHDPGSGAVSTHGGGDGELYAPWGLSADSDGNVYVADSANHRFQKFTSNGTFLGWFGRDAEGYTGWHTPGSSKVPVCGSGDGEFGCAYDSPNSITVDGAGNVYVADYRNNRIQKFRPVAP